MIGYLKLLGNWNNLNFIERYKMIEYYWDYFDFFLHHCSEEEYNNLNDFVDSNYFKEYFENHKINGIIYEFCFNEL